MTQFSTDKIFISDLDGTLLQDDASLSSFARTELTQLIEKGIPFTIATARGVVTVKEILGDLPLQLPIVCSNGAYTSDLHTGGHTAVHGLTKPMDAEIHALVKEAGFDMFVSTYDEQVDGLFYDNISNEAMNWYWHERTRANDKRLRRVDDTAEVMAHQVININVLSLRAPLMELEAALRVKFGPRIHTYFYENWADPSWYWLSIFDYHATKGNAIQRLLDTYGFSSENLTVFGDSYNDLPMFEMAGKAMAMEGAVPALKQIATQTIGSNSDDSVVRYIRSEV